MQQNLDGTEKLTEVARILKSSYPDVTEDEVEACISADWPDTDPEEHSAWIESAPAQEIADWAADWIEENRRENPTAHFGPAETITCIECGRVFTQHEDSGRQYGKCPGCGHTNSAMDRAFGIQRGEELVMLTDCRGERGLDLYAVPAGTDNPQDAVKYRRIAHWSQDGEYGEWILPSGEPSGITEKDCAHYIGEAH